MTSLSPSRLCFRVFQKYYVFAFGVPNILPYFGNDKWKYYLQCETAKFISFYLQNNPSFFMQLCILNSNYLYPKRLGIFI